MKEQEYTVTNIKSFTLKDIFECGQCFRWKEQEDGSYIGIFGENVIQVKKQQDTIYFQGICQGDIQTIVQEYFDLARDYEKIKEQLSQIDLAMKTSIDYGKGIRILNQDLWETIASFLISANNNIPRIKGIIEKLAKNYGKQIVYQTNTYYTFPTPEELREVTIEDYRKLGLGFRDKRLYETVQKILKKEIDLEQLKQNPNTKQVKEQLLMLDGVGPKVADCILLFSTLKRLEVFPIDVWVRRVMNDLYFHEKEEKKISKQQMEQFAKEKFGNLAGMAQQYLFYWRREA